MGSARGIWHLWRTLKPLFELDWVVSSVPRGHQRWALLASACTVAARTTSVHRGFPLSGSTLGTGNAERPASLEPGNKNLFLQQNGGFSAAGQQHLYFLVFDIFHLYNLFRLKPQALLGLYQQALAILKSKGATIEFGHIDPRSTIGFELAAWLHEQAKQQFKHSYCSPKGLLYSFQNLLKLYPEYFLAE